MEIVKLFKMMAKHDASDLHIKVGQPPVFRVAGTLSRVQNTEPLNDEQARKLIEPLMNDDQRHKLEANGNEDFAWYDEDIGRFRCNVFLQRGYLSAAIRRVSLEIPSYDQLHLPPQIARCAAFEQGLVLVGGVTGSGKSTTLAAILDRMAIVSQREIGIDVTGFQDALRAAVRQDPDVMLIGEMRDAETFETALTAAETGHLVFGTIHASSCAQSIGRILDLFPEERHAQIRAGLGFNLRAVLNQKLLRGKRKDLPRVPAMEAMFVTPVIRKFILDGEDHRVADAIKADTEHGCESFNQVLARLVKEDVVGNDVALKASPNPEELRMALSGISITDSGGIV